MNQYAHNVVQIIVYRWAPTLQYLVLKRSEQDGGWWQPVTGHVELGETERDAALRELFEETGVMKPTYLSNPIQIQSYSSDDGQAQAFVYMAEIPAKQPITLSSEHSEYRWLDLESALGLLRYEGNKKNMRRADALLAEAR